MFGSWKSRRVNVNSKIRFDNSSIGSQVKIMVWTSVFILDCLIIFSSIFKTDHVIWRRRKFMISVSRD